MLKRLTEISNKDARLVVGLMSGTSADGIDAALVRIEGCGPSSKVEQIAFSELPYSRELRKAVLRLADLKASAVDYICHMNFLLGELFAQAALEVIRKAGLRPGEVDLIGSHGHTAYHIPKPIRDFGFDIRSTLQIGEPSVIAERTGIITVADFRVRDVAAGGQGAPLVPYTEYILYRDKQRCIGLQNIGGIANITVLPPDCTPGGIIAFDNGPGNMVIDEVVSRLTGADKSFDENGAMAQKGKVNRSLLGLLMEDRYFSMKPPKTTGREYFGSAYADRVMQLAGRLGVGPFDLVATVTALTANAISESIRRFVMPSAGLDRLIVGGGGSYNRALMNMLRELLPEVEVLTQEDAGFSGSAKEAVAFAILANEAVCGSCNNVPGATGAAHPVIMGKICL